MKFSELSTDRGLDVLCEITPCIGSIVTDSDLVAELKRNTGIDSTATQAEVWRAALDKITKLLPIILNTHRKDIYSIVGAINGKKASKVATQPFLETAAQIKEIVDDVEFKNFFKSLWNTERA